MRPALALAALMLAATPALAQSVPAYDNAWYRSNGWGGEYANGFTVLKDTTVILRPELSPAAEKSIDCPLPAKATYHPWNTQRVEAQGLSFVSYSEIEEWEATTAFEALFYPDVDPAIGDPSLEVETTLTFKPGDRWTYLTYYCEGTFLMEYEGKKYTADQGLIEASKQIKPGDARLDEWLRINCDNNMWGWLYLPDVISDEASFTGPNIPGYGVAADAE
jgi:hypothetical protein